MDLLHEYNEMDVPYMKLYSNEFQKKAEREKLNGKCTCIQSFENEICVDFHTIGTVMSAHTSFCMYLHVCVCACDPFKGEC